MTLRSYLPRRCGVRTYLRWLASTARMRLVDRLTGDAMVLKNLDVPIAVDLSHGDSYLLGRNRVVAISCHASAADPANMNIGGSLEATTFSVDGGRVPNRLTFGN